MRTKFVRCVFASAFRGIFVSFFLTYVKLFLDFITNNLIEKSYEQEF